MTVRNILFIMADQLRWDHLACAGHPAIRTPHLDALARRGVRFAQAYVQSGVCGPSRMSFYTGRYVSSHRATWNRVPLPIDEVTLGEYFKGHGRRLHLVGKSHVMPNPAAWARLDIDGQGALGRLLREGHFTVDDRHDGHHAETDSAYADYLRAQGYDSPDPWSDFVISALDESGTPVSGWKMRNVHLPARVREEHSETAYTTDRAIEFMRARGDEPWAMHLSYVKPHWPYLAPAPYHALYRFKDCLPVVRRPEELSDAHPVLAAYRQQEECVNFMRDEVIERVRPAYQGLITQLDHHLGRLWDELDRLGRWQDTLVVFTADHGDYLGDHWLGEKELFHDTIQRVPLLVFDPSPAADATRGQVRTELVESIDLAPTFLESLGLPVPLHRLEGASLLALTRATATPADWRLAVFSELDYSYRKARLILGRDPFECRAWMIRTATHKLVEWEGYRPQFFDLAADPEEFFDLGAHAAQSGVARLLRERLWQWLSTRKIRTSVSAADVERGTDRYKDAGVFYGEW